MKVCIFGMGAVGSHLAAGLSDTSVKLSGIARGEHLQAIQRDGLQFRSQGSTRQVRLNVTSDPAELGPQEVVIVTLKSYALAEAAPLIKPLLGARTSIIYAVNGIPWWYFHKHSGALAERRIPRLDPAGALWDELGVERALGMVVYSPNTLVAPGVVHSGSASNRFLIGEPGGGISQRLAQVVDALQPGLPGLAASDNIRQPLWQKLLLNVPSALIGCLAQVAGNDIATQPELRKLFITIAQEAAQVAARVGIEVVDDTEQKLALLAGAGHRSSIVQDLLAGRRIEFDGQIEAVRDIAGELAVDLPMIDALAGLLKHRAGLAPA